MAVESHRSPSGTAPFRHREVPLHWPTVSDLEEATEELHESYQRVREDLGRVFVAFEDLRNAGATDDVHGLLDRLEDVIKDVRTGGVFGSGANSHRRARERWIEAGGQP